MNLSANTLFHITPKLEFLLNILKNGFYPRYCIEEIGFFTALSEDNQYLAQPMVCFCDIPLSSLKQHIDKYGYYGLGMDKNWGMSKGISPVTYVYPHSSTGDLIRLISFKSFLLLDEDKFDQFIGLTQILKNYYKSISGHMYKNGNFGKELYNFYDEREWRYVPFVEIEKLYEKDKRARTFLEKEIFDNLQERENFNKLLGENCSLKFHYKDIRYLFVKDNDEKEILLNFIEDIYMLDKDRKEIRNLTSKIYTLDTMLEDL